MTEPKDYDESDYWLYDEEEDEYPPAWIGVALLIILLAVAVTIGYFVFSILKH